MNEIEQECIRRIAEVKGLQPEALSPDTSLDEIGVDSLDRVSLSFDLEEQYGIQIPENRLQQIRTVADIAAAVQEAIAQKQGASTTPEATDVSGTAGPT